MGRHIRPSTVVALLALFVSLGGTGYAAVKINGKNIKARTVTGKKLKNNTLTGKQIKESKLGTVSKAKTATTVGTATTLPARAASGLVRRAKVLDTDLVKLPAVGTSQASSPLKTIFVHGPFAFQAACWNAPGGETAVRLRFTSREPGSILGDDPLPVDVTDQELARDPDDMQVPLAAPSGATLSASLYYGIKRLGGDCVMAVDGVATP